MEFNVEKGYELEFTRETPISMYYVWLNGYLEACKQLGVFIEKSPIGEYSKGIVKGYTQKNNIKHMKDAICGSSTEKLTKIIEKYLVDYDLFLKNEELAFDKKFVTNLMSGFVITFILGDTNHKLQQKALDARIKTERLFPLLQTVLLKDNDKLKTYDEIIEKTQINNLNERKHCLLTINGPKLN